MAMPVPFDAPAPRLCHLVKWPHFDGYGFNLHAEKLKMGQFVGKVDVDSPAEAAGLREGDRIIEVNGVNIANENHRQVVERIKAVPNETKLLVLDAADDDWYKSRGLVAKGNQKNVIFMKTPVAGETNDDQPNGQHEEVSEISRVQNPGDEQEESPVAQVSNRPSTPTPTTTTKQDQKSCREVTSTQDQVEEDEETITAGVQSISCNEDDRNTSTSPDKMGKTHILNNNNVDVVKNHNSGDNNSGNRKTSVKNDYPFSDGPKEVGKDAEDGIPASPSSTKSGSSSQLSNGGHSSLEGGTLEMNLNLSVSEMRQLLAQKKKPDPKKVQMDLKQKYEIISSM